MEEKFKTYLIKNGYSLTTPSGNPSTVYSYIKSVYKVCEWEHLSLGSLANQIETIICMYDIGGDKEDLGNKSHKTVINALKQFQNFLLTTY